ncbi:MAG: MFS transporter, partial [Candidatus Hodarchaeales archaeon]
MANKCTKGNKLSILVNYLGIQTISLDARKVIYKYMILDYSSILVALLSNTFFILFVIGQTDYTRAGFIISLMMIVQMIIDYPSGSLGDYIGQRWLLIFANISYAVAYFILPFANSIIDFLIVASILGIANAQASGTLETWIDNNYQQVVGENDPEKKIYGFSLARITTFRRVFSAGGVMIGGILSTLESREFVFSIQGFLYLFNCLLIILLLKGGIRKNTGNIKEEYFTFVKGGLKCLISDRAVFFFIIGFSISTATWAIWVNLLQKPIYFGYTGLDSFASLLRSLILILGIPIGILTANISKKFNNRVYPYIVLIHNFLFFPSLVILLTAIPMLNSFNLIGFLSVLLIQLVLTSSLYYIGETLRQRVMIELIPSEHRNAIYSLIPTIVALIGFPLIPITGRMIDL